jgi:hypothetical protein
MLPGSASGCADDDQENSGNAQRTFGIVQATFQIIRGTFGAVSQTQVEDVNAARQRVRVRG